MTEFSGPAWCQHFPTRSDVSGLIPTFQDKVNPFIATLRTAGALVHISVTQRPKERAYLMHWAWAIAHGLPANMCRPGDKPGVPVPPESVPAEDGVDIDWTCAGDVGASRHAAAQMVTGYGMDVCAALDSLHIEGRAIDMTITWNGMLNLKDANGSPWAIASLPHTGMHPQLWAVGKTFGVIKLPTDPPHWSDNGH